MRAARLMSIVFEVDSSPGITAAQLAVALGVSVRTVYRDVTALQVAGVPLYGVAGHGGGLHLAEGYRSRAAALRADEASALLAGVVPAVAEQLGVGERAQRAARKVHRQAGGRAGSEHVLVDPLGWYRATDEVPHLPTLAEAVRSQRVVSITYRRWEEPTLVRRRVEPWGLVLKAGTWYLMARRRGQVRTYRVDQVVSARPTTVEFERDPDFDLAAAWTAFVASFQERLLVVEVRVRLTRAGRDRLRAEGDAAPRAAIAALLAGRPDDDRDLEVALPYESLERAVDDVLRLGADATPLAPPELVESVRATVTALALRYLAEPRPSRRRDR